MSKREPTHEEILAQRKLLEAAGVIVGDPIEIIADTTTTTTGKELAMAKHRTTRTNAEAPPGEPPAEVPSDSGNGPTPPKVLDTMRTVLASITIDEVRQFAKLLGIAPSASAQEFFDALKSASESQTTAESHGLSARELRIIKEVGSTPAAYLRAKRERAARGEGRLP